MGIQSSINGLVASVLGAATAKSLKSKQSVAATGDSGGGQEPTKQMHASQKGVNQQEMVAMKETALAKNPGFDKVAANSQGLLNPQIFTTYSEHAETTSLENMAKEVKGRFRQREDFKKRLTASRKKIGGR